MGNPQKRKKQTACNKARHRTLKLKHYERDLDEIHRDFLQPEKVQKMIEDDEDREGQVYCVECARFFINPKALVSHVRSKTHKKRIRELREVPYSREEAERCAGMTQVVKEVRMKEAYEWVKE